MIGTNTSGHAALGVVVQPYRAGAIYSIDDETPWLAVGFTEKPAAKFAETARQGRMERFRDGPPDGLHWWKWFPIAEDDADIGRLRRYGYYQARLHQPVQLGLQCYVWPRRFCDAASYQAMLRAIEDEFGRPIEWERTDVPIRTSVLPRAGQPTDAELVQTIGSELAAVHALERTGALAQLAEPADDSPPEARLVRMWAWRRLADLVGLRARLAAVVSAHEAASTDSNQKRAHRRRVRAGTARDDHTAATAVLAQVSRLAVRHGDSSGFLLSPAMQRDHRLRRLVRAFAPATREHWAPVLTRSVSTHPPLKASEVFELWGVARIVRALGVLGWVVTARRYGGAAIGGTSTAVERHGVELARHGLRLDLEFNPGIEHVGCADAPPMHVRQQPLLEWAHANLVASDGLFATADLTPDYAMRMWSADGRPMALAIGDATLSDPRHVADPEAPNERGRTKADKLITYRERIGWRAGGRLLRCLPACTFMILPGPASRWQDVGALQEADCVALCPDPAVALDSDLEQRLEGLLDAMRSAASASRSTG